MRQGSEEAPRQGGVSRGKAIPRIGLSAWYPPLQRRRLGALTHGRRRKRPYRKVAWVLIGRVTVFWLWLALELCENLVFAERNALEGGGTNSRASGLGK